MLQERCDICKEKDSDLRLSSGHQICSKCFTEIAQKSQRTQELKNLNGDLTIPNS